MTLKNNTTTIVKGILATLLLLCLIDADYGFYQAMRTLISFGFAFLTYRYYQTGDKTNAIIYFCLLIVFQPLLKIGLGRGIWIVADLLVSVFLIYQILRSPREYLSTKTKQPNSFKTNNNNTNEASINDKAASIRKKW